MIKYKTRREKNLSNSTGLWRNRLTQIFWSWKLEATCLEFRYHCEGPSTVPSIYSSPDRSNLIITNTTAIRISEQPRVCVANGLLNSSSIWQLTVIPKYKHTKQRHWVITHCPKAHQKPWSSIIRHRAIFKRQKRKLAHILFWGIHPCTARPKRQLANEAGV